MSNKETTANSHLSASSTHANGEEGKSSGSFLWQKNVTPTAEIERFTVGRDRELDLFLAESDVIGSMAHITMLESIGLLKSEELTTLLAELRTILSSIKAGSFVIEEGIEDVHSQVELMLTRRLGDVGKKIHSGRSRNDQVLLDLKLWTRRQIREIAALSKALFDELQTQSERYKDVLMPGYTHLQVAMPSSFGLWFGAYAESLADDMLFLQAAYRMANRNPLGSAAGYGSSFPLNREMTTRLLGFDSMNYNVVYAQMGRGKMERNVAFALASIAGTISKLAFDACLFNSQNFAFVKLPDECTTGSSIMPHKKNPDVFELTRAKCNKIQSLPQQVMMIMNNLPSGYFRDLQIIKEIFLPAFGELRDCLQMAAYIVNRMKVNEHILDDPRYDLMFSVEEVNRLATAGMPFRDAYRKVGLDIEAGQFTPRKEVNHTHAGSIGNLCTSQIRTLMEQTLAECHFERAEEAERKLVEEA
ncbi:MAG: argininosuccinate lyase [Bacteroidaceae bacterium]|nr:argininosuccinate lyase [Bacteroidaceae bacterium]